MKTKIHILAVILILNVTLLYAGDPVIIILKANNKANEIYLSVTELAPVTPKEAGFNDFEPRPISGINRLVSITTAEVDLEIITAESGTLSIEPLLLQKVAPTTPKEAGFEDSVTEPVTGINSLTPVSPLVAEFEE